jgi:hypothetical protein
LKKIVSTCILLLILPMLTANPLFDEIDGLRDQKRYQQAFDLLEQNYSNANGSAERAEFLWRMAMVTLEIGDQAEDNPNISKSERLENLYSRSRIRPSGNSNRFA